MSGQSSMEAGRASHGIHFRLVLFASLAICALVVAGCNEGPGAENCNDGHNEEAQAWVTLPERAGSRTETSGSVPHEQKNVKPVHDVDAELKRRVYNLLPGTTNPPTAIGADGSIALWLKEEWESPMVEKIVEREFAHIHPDGSLHAVLPLARACDAYFKKWAEFHPWAGGRMWDGLVMFYTPQNFDELEITWQLVVDSYNFVASQNLNATDLATH